MESDNTLLKKYKVTLYLMKDPTINDDTFAHPYVVDAINEKSAYNKAEALQSLDIPEIRYKSIFNYKVTEIV